MADFLFPPVGGIASFLEGAAGLVFSIARERMIKNASLFGIKLMAARIFSCGAVKESLNLVERMGGAEGVGGVAAVFFAVG